MTDLSAACAADGAIRSVLARVSRAQDDLDYHAFLACFTENVFLEKAVMIPDWRPGPIAGARLCRLILEGLSKYDATHHMVFNHMIEVNGCQARCLADVNTAHILNEGEVSRWCISAGRYSLSLTLEERGWLISERSMVVRYKIGDETVLEAAKGPPRRQINFEAGQS